MPRVYIPVASPDDWKRLLAEPEKQWRRGFSARTLAHSWLASNGLPPEIHALFATSSIDALRSLEPLIVIPEHQVFLPPVSGHLSQNDVFVVARAADGALVSITVEGKVSESFDRAIEEWLTPQTAGKRERLAFLAQKLGLEGGVPPRIRYQLLHRAASAIIEAEWFGARYAAMVVHSFSQSDEWFGDFASFVELFGQEAAVGSLAVLREVPAMTVLAGWAHGDPRSFGA